MRIVAIAAIIFSRLLVLARPEPRNPPPRPGPLVASLVLVHGLRRVLEDVFSDRRTNRLAIAGR